MTIKQFASKHRLTVSMDECNDPVIQGRIGSSNIYEYCDNVLGVMFITDAKKPARTFLWKKFKGAALGNGMTILQDGYAEGSFAFDPKDEKQARIAIRGIRARIKKVLTETQRVALSRNQFRPRLNGPQLSAKTSGIVPDEENPQGVLNLDSDVRK